MVISKKTDNIILLLSIILMTMALYTRDLLGNNVSKYYFMILAVAPSILMSLSSLVYFIFFLFPLTSGLPSNYIFPLLIGLILIKNSNSFERGGLYCFLIIVFMEVIHFFVYSFGINWSSTIGYLANIFLLCYLVSMRNNDIDKQKCLYSFCFGLAVFLFAIYYITQVSGSIDMLMEEQGRLGNTKSVSDAERGVMMLNANPNGLGFFSIVGVCIVFVLYSVKRMRLWVMVTLSSLYLYVGSLGISRSFFICILAMVALFLLFRGGSGRKSSWSRYLVLLVFFAAASFLLLNETSILDAYTRRFSDSTFKSMGSRTEIFVAYNKYLLDNPEYLLGGTGAVHYGKVIDSIPYSTHNGLQQIVVSYGLIGLIVFFVMTVFAIKRCYKRRNPVFLIPFLIALLYVQGGQLLNPSNNLYLFIVSFFIMKLSLDDMTPNHLPSKP